jgi:hypothetical protein
MDLGSFLIKVTQMGRMVVIHFTEVVYAALYFHLSHIWCPFTLHVTYTSLSFLFFQIGWVSSFLYGFLAAFYNNVSVSLLYSCMSIVGCCSSADV